MFARLNKKDGPEGPPLFLLKRFHKALICVVKCIAIFAKHGRFAFVRAVHLYVQVFDWVHVVNLAFFATVITVMHDLFLLFCLKRWCYPNTNEASSSIAS